MRKSILPARLKRRHEKHEKADYDKVYEHPLDWCPLFGDLPDIEETHLNNNKLAKSTARNCINIIHAARWYLGVFDDYHVQYARLPDVKELFFIYHGYGEACKAVRILFQNLDYLALKTAHSYSPFIAMQLGACGEITTIPNKPIGRVSNLWDNCFSVTAGEVRVDQIVREYLLAEAQKITGDSVVLNYSKLFSLYAILESWLILTSLHLNKKHNAEYLLHCREKLTYANILLNIADFYSEIEEKYELYKEIQNNKNKAITASKTGGSKPKAPGFQEAIKQAIKIKKTTNASILWKYFKVNYKGKNNSMKCDIYLIYYLPDKSLNNSDGFLYQFNIKNKKIRKNTFSAFEKNIHKVKNDLKKE